MLEETRYLETSRSWTNEEARAALGARLTKEAKALDAEIQDLVRRDRLGKHELCARLGRMHDDELWKHLSDYTSFADYAVKVGAASSHTAAKDMAKLSRDLRPLHLLRAVFEAGLADWTKIKEAAPAALAKPEDEASWAHEVQVSTVNEIRAKAQLALGKPPTANMTLSLPRDVRALWEHGRRVAGERAGTLLTQGEFAERLLDAAVRTGLVSKGPVDPAAEPTGDEEWTESSRIPPPTAVLHLHRCERCEVTELEGPDGPVILAPERAALLTEDCWIQDAEGGLTRAIPERVRRQVYARDRGRCRRPGCGALGAIHVHHVGEGGWKKTGHEADGLLLLCGSDHREHHKGWFSIQGDQPSGFVFLDPAGNPLRPPGRSSWQPTPAPAAAKKARQAERMAGEAGRPDDVLRDVRMALKVMEFKAEEAKAYLAHVLPQLPLEATASEIVAAVLRAKR